MARYKECRESKGLSQKYVALAIGVKPPQISKWEAGTSSPSRENCIKLAELYNVSVDYLLGLVDDPQGEKEPAATTPPQIAVMLRAMEKMTPEQQKTMIDLGKAAFAKYFDIPTDDEST